MSLHPMRSRAAVLRLRPRRLPLSCSLSAIAAALAFGAPAAAARPPARPANTAAAPASGQGFAELVAEAASRFGLPERWLRAVIRVESGGTARALSHAGAMGLMQLMPKTYAALRARLGLGADAFDPRNNVLAGAAYLRAMYDRFGPGGFLAAYNAGPERYAEHVARGRPLPAETRAYVARLASEITPASSSAPPRLQLDSLFTEFQPPVTKELVAPRAGGSTASKTLAPPPSTSRASALAPRASGLFAPVQQEIRP